MRRPTLGCSASDYMALLADASGLSSANEARAKLYDCARHGEVDACRAILDVWSRRRLHIACANGHAGVVRLLLSRGATLLMTCQTGP